MAAITQTMHDNHDDDPGFDNELRVRVITCSNECDHDCDVNVLPEQSWSQRLMEEGWIVVLWQTEPNESGHSLHRLQFCDLGCLYEHMRARVLLDPEWSPKIENLDTTAFGKYREMLRQRHNH